MSSLPQRAALLFGSAIVCLSVASWIARQSEFATPQLYILALAALAFSAFIAIKRVHAPQPFSLALAGVPNEPRREASPGITRIIQAPSLEFESAVRDWVQARSSPETGFQQLLAAMAEVIFILDDAGRYLRIAPTNPSRLYKPRDELIGKSLSEVFPPAQADLFLAQIRRALDTNARVHFEYPLEINAHEFWFAASVSPLTATSVLWVARDVTEDKQRTREIERRNRELDALFQIGQSLSRLAPQSEILETVYVSLGQALDNRNLYLALHSESSQQIHFPIYTIAGERHPPFARSLDNGVTEYILRTRAPLFLPRAAEQEFRTRGIAPVGTPCRSYLGVPMLAGDKAVGVIAVQDYEKEDVFDEHDLGLLATVASQVASAMENARLYSEAQVRAEEFRALYQTTRSLSFDRDLPTLLQSIVEDATSLLGTSAGAILLYRADLDALEFSAILGLPIPRGARMRRNEGFAGQVFETRAPLVIEDYAHWEHRSSQFEKFDLRAMIGVPLIYRGEPIGVLQFGEAGNSPRQFTESDQRLLSLFAHQVAGAIHNARLFAETQKRATQLSLLNAITTAASSASSLKEMLQTLADRMGELFEAEGAYITLWDDAQRMTIPAAAYGPLRETYPNRPPTNNIQTMTRSVLDAGHALAAEDVFNSPYVNATLSANYPARSLLGLPLIAGDKKLGAVMIGFNAPRHFTPEEMAFGEQAARQIAVAVAKTQWSEEAQRRAREFETLYQVTRDLSAYHDLPTLLETILDRATGLFDTATGSITLYDNARGDLELVAAKEFPIAIGTRLALGTGIAGKAALERAPVIVENYQTWEHRTSFLEGTPFTAALCVPMLYRGELIGTLAVRRKNNSTRPFTPSDARLLSLFASHAASVVRYTRLFDEARTRADQMALLYDAGLTLNRVLDPKEQLEFLVQLAARTLRADRAIFYRYDSVQQILRAETAVGYATEILRRINELQFSLKNDASIPGRVLSSQLAVNLPNVAADPRYIAIDPAIKAGLWVPIQHESLSRGVLCVFSVRENAFTAQDELLLTLYAHQVSAAMGNAELFGEINRRLVELQAINKLSRALRAAHTREEILPLFLDQTLALFETTAGAIWLYDATTGMMHQAAARGWFERIAEQPFRPNVGIAGVVFSTGELYLSREFVSDPLTRPSIISQLPVGWGGACVPIRSSEGTLGVLFVSVPTPREMDQPQARLLTTLAEIAGNTVHRLNLHQSLEETFVQTIAALAHAIDARDNYTGNHSTRVSDLATALARALGVGKDQEEAVRFAGLLHDIGKIAIPDAILHKPDKLTDSEWKLVKQHPITGAEILQSIRQLEPVVPVVRYHQEKFDGSGYPDGLRGDAIPIGARILSVADAFSAITDQRPYRQAKTGTQALAEIERCAGTQFDPRIVAAFKQMLDANRAN